MPISISERLHTIVQYIPKVSVLADIGTDHAFIPIHTIQTNRIERAIATDLRRGPLEKARQNVHRHALQRDIQLRLGDGLATLEPGEADVIVSAGIGGHVHAQMITLYPHVAQSASRLIFQPMNAGHVLRQQLDEQGYVIETEVLVLDDDKIYEIIAVKPGDGRDHAYDVYRHDSDALELAYAYGPLLLQSPNDLLRLRLEREVEKLLSVRRRVQKSDNLAARERIAEVERQAAKLTALMEGGTER